MTSGEVGDLVYRIYSDDSIRVFRISYVIGSTHFKGEFMYGTADVNSAYVGQRNFLLYYPLDSDIDTLEKFKDKYPEYFV